MLRRGYAKHPHAKFFHVTLNLVPTVDFVLISVVLQAADAGNALSVLFCGCSHTSHTRSCVICMEMGKRGTFSCVHSLYNFWESWYTGIFSQPLLQEKVFMNIATPV